MLYNISFLFYRIFFLQFSYQKKWRNYCGNRYCKFSARHISFIHQRRIKVKITSINLINFIHHSTNSTWIPYLFKLLHSCNRIIIKSTNHIQI